MNSTFSDKSAIAHVSNRSHRMTVDNYAHSPRHALVYGGENGAYGRGARNGNVKLNYEAKIIEAVVRAGFDEFEMF